MEDTRYMKLALQLAEKGAGYVNPNPMVGAVIVKDGRVIGQGWHERWGGPHAEKNALKHCTEPPGGATLYVTLEPCCHYGKTPPCTEAIIKNNIKKVVIGTLDPNPAMSGKSAALLREHGIEVKVGILEEDCKYKIKEFAKYITTATPYVMMKYAMTMDGKIASRTGQSKWITGEAARSHVQKTRNQYAAIMVGADTVIKDDPLLTCRLEGGKNPIRVICDTHLRIPLSSKLMETAGEVRTIVATCCRDSRAQEPYRQKGCEIAVIDEKDGHVDLKKLMEYLGKSEIDSVLLEGGAGLNWSALKQHVADGVQAYIAPKLLGGAQSQTPVAGLGVLAPQDAFHLKNTTIRQIGTDYLIEGELQRAAEGEVLHSCSQEL